MARADAKHTAQFYFRMLAQHAGMRWTSDNAAELDGLIDEIIDTAVNEAIVAVRLGLQKKGGL